MNLKNMKTSNTPNWFKVASIVVHSLFITIVCYNLFSHNQIMGIKILAPLFLGISAYRIIYILRRYSNYSHPWFSKK